MTCCFNFKCWERNSEWALPIPRRLPLLVAGVWGDFAKETERVEREHKWTILVQ